MPPLDEVLENYVGRGEQEERARERERERKRAREKREREREREREKEIARGEREREREREGNAPFRPSAIRRSCQHDGKEKDHHKARKSLTATIGQRPVPHRESNQFE